MPRSNRIRVTELTPDPDWVHRRVPARKDLIDLIEKLTGTSITQNIAKDPERWVEELDLINLMLTREHISTGTGFGEPPLGETDCIPLGPNTHRYVGNNVRCRGLWYKKKPDSEQWTHCRIGSTADLTLRAELETHAEGFLPQNFERESELVKNNPRPIRRFSVPTAGGPLTVYAKGSTILPSTYYYEIPRSRLTSIARLNIVTSLDERRIFERLGKNGVHVPRVLGTYASPAESWLFVEGVDGKTIPDALGTHRDTIIAQDAAYLATLCWLGYHKQGFEDFDDKIFDGEKLYAIDVNEVVDIYGPYGVDFKTLLQDPRDRNALRSFRAWQRRLFLRHARDAIHTYRQTLCPTAPHRLAYLNAFCDALNWKLTPQQQERIIDNEDHTTLEQELGAMCDD